MNRMKDRFPACRGRSGCGGVGGQPFLGDLSQSSADSGNLGEASEIFLHLLLSLLT